MAVGGYVAYVFIDCHRLPDVDNPVPSSRIADGPYVECQTFVCTLDGFIVSDNVRVERCGVVDETFRCSDHNPVVLRFELTGE